MPQLDPDIVEAKLIVLLQGVFGAGTEVRGLTSGDIDEQGNLLVKPPACLVLLDGGDDVCSENKRLSYWASQRWFLVAGAMNLQSTGQERLDALKMIATLRRGISGKTLDLDGDGNADTSPILLGGFDRFQFDAGGTWYAQKIVVDAAIYFGS
jgi:hypothetical protein